ncbi:mCG1041513 [Mus musculus]|nr:mCG1041513 [Mus musculus]
MKVELRVLDSPSPHPGASQRSFPLLFFWLSSALCLEVPRMPSSEESDGRGLWPIQGCEVERQQWIDPSIYRSALWSVPHSSCALAS